MRFPFRVRVGRRSEVIVTDTTRHYYSAGDVKTRQLQVVDAAGKSMLLTCMNLSAPGLLHEIAVYGHAETLGC